MSRLVEEPAKFQARGVEGSLVIFAPVLKEQPAILDHLAEDQIDGLVSQRSVVVELSNELATQWPHVVDVFLEWSSGSDLPPPDV